MSGQGDLVLRVVREGLLLVLVLSGPPLLASPQPAESREDQPL